jgi:hypothetical protein
MSVARMNSFIEIVSTNSTKDSEGFVARGDTVVANVRAYFEPKNASEKWRNNAAFTEASALFRFRAIPGVAIDSTLYILCGGDRYRIISAEDVRRRGMYIEAICAKVESTVY